MTQCARVDVVLPAGGRIEGHFAAEANTTIKALICVDGDTILEHTLRVLRASPRIGRIVVVGPAELGACVSERWGATFVVEGNTGPENVFRGLEWLRGANDGPTRRTLIMTTDLPFLNTDAVGQFLEACPPEAEVAVSVHERREVEARFPDWRATYVRLRDGEWTTGCAFLVAPCHLFANRRHIESIFAARKSQLAMGRLLGIGFVVRFLLRRLAMSDIVRRCEQILGCRTAAVLGAPPELCFDLDSVNDFRYAVGRAMENTRARVRP